MRTLFLSLVIFHASLAIADEKPAQIQFNRDVRPILSDRCFLCHGPDQSSEQAKESDLRLDDREAAIDFGVFDFDDASNSELILRVLSDDPDQQMPPPESQKKPLSSAEVETLTTWIQQGSQYQQHWAYIAPKRAELPTVKAKDRVHNPIDSFVISRLEKQEIEGAATADRQTLIRRVTFDLIGLPPTTAEIDDFVNDPASTNAAYEKVVDRLLKSPHYGEQMARYWLDASRYADTSGYQYDRERKQWVWRDWVIHAFNENMPFDEFTIQQIAGDMLPDATDQTRLATGFHRNHPITIEGGVVDEEYRTEYVIDRVVTTSTVWMGQTFLCARCHDHKFDPISQENFYQFYSFFNNVPERGLNGFNPQQKIASPLNTRTQAIQRKLAAATSKIVSLALPLESWEKRLRSETPVWIARKPDSIKSTGGATAKVQDDKSVLMSGKNPPTDDYLLEFKSDQKVQAIQLEAILDPSLTNGSTSRGSNGNFVLSEFTVEAKAKGTTKFQKYAILDATADYEQSKYTINLTYDGKIDSSGWAVDGNSKPANRTATFNLANSIPVGSIIRVTMQHRYGASHQIGRFRLSFSENLSTSAKVEKLMAVAPKKRNAEQNATLRMLLVQKYGDAKSQSHVQSLQALQDEMKQASAVPATMVMSEMPKPRLAYVLDRGEYDKPIKERPVQPAVPKSMGRLPETFPQNRLGLAQWLVAKDQPLTARVTVNRFWQRLFGVGLVKTSEDFGSQGEFPSHPQLLDWLAVEFMSSGWNVKQILKTIVMSNTYRQSSHITKESFARDPENRLLARGPRIRLDGEVIRDSALAIAGLMNTTVGGPSVYPYHPNGLWLEINNRPGYSRAYPHQTDTNQHHRRTLYTFWKRTVPPPSVATFDAPSREYCVVRRSSTNTPLQAFVMLHDPQFVEAARHVATRMINEGGESVASQIAFGFRCCTSRSPSEKELAILLNTHSDRLKQYEADTAAAEKLLSVGVSPVKDGVDKAKLAAMTQVARMLMNLSEFLTKG